MDGYVDYGFIRAKVLEVSKWADTLTGPENEKILIETAASFNSRYFAKSGFGVFVYRDGRKLAGPEADIMDSIPHPLLEAEDDRLMVLDSNVYFSALRGDCRLILVNDRFSIKHSNEVTDHAFMLFALLFIVLTLTVTLSGLLTRRMIIRPIMAAINVLSRGVSQIREGNLAYKLNYDVKDEFYDICRVFNEMADRLLQSDGQKRRDEESRRCLIAGISHDLRSPLASIKAYAEGLLDGAAETEEEKEEYLRVIVTRSDNMEKIVQQLFMFSQLDLYNYPISLKLCDFDEELEKLIYRERDAYALDGLGLSLNLAAKPAKVNLDLSLFQIVLSNIFGNSLKYGDQARSLMKISSRVESATVHLDLTDNGPGVPEEKLGQLFDMFFRVDDDGLRTGHGLGLAISAKIISRLGGTIAARNAPEGGLCIEIKLPIIWNGEDDERQSFNNR
jgi:signal transduction histidine kinase